MIEAEWRRACRVGVVALAALAIAPRLARAQETARELVLADRGPHFLSEPSSAATLGVDASSAAVLRRRVSLTVVSVTLEQALDAIGRQVGVRFTYSRAVAPLDRHVSLDAHDLTVAAALTEILFDTGVDVEVGSGGHLTLIRHANLLAATAKPQQGIGGVSGRVTDAVTRVPLDQVAVRLEGSGMGAVTTSDGRYTVHNVPLGMYRVAARRVGYTPLTKIVIVSDSVAEADFALTAVPTRLNEMVTTAVGDQRRYEVGNTISTINADSIVPTAPIASLTDVISARAPGVVVEETTGLTGSGEAIRIRGQSSLVLQGDPIVIVDGVRQDNAPGGTYVASAGPLGSGATPSPSRLNDLGFNDIQTIDVLKGPAASTEYGTDAANGVIVITTKHGTAGRPKWHASAEATRSAVPEHFPTVYYNWGHTTDGMNTAVQCPLVPFPFGSGVGSATGSCAVDSVTAWNPLNHPYYSIFDAGHRQKYDLSVSGGSEAARYYVAGSIANELGMLRMPGVFVAQAHTLGLPQAVFDPNSEAQRSARGNTAIRLGATADLSVTGAYLSTNQVAPNQRNLFDVIRPPVRDSAHYYGYGFSFESPLVGFGQPTSQTTNRLTGGVTASWRPAPWFVGHGTWGIDHGSQRHTAAFLPQVSPLFFNVPGQLEIGNATTDIYTVDLRGSATASLASGVRAVTSVGLQLADTRQQGVTAMAIGVTATNFTLNGSVSPVVTQLGNRQATLGGYGEEQLGFADRLFLTGAIRVDAASGFGQAYSTAAYPKASLSWLAISTEPTSVRLRAAFGKSGVQPPNGAALQLYAPTVQLSAGAPASAVQIANVQNQTLRPERSAEIEGGLDLGLWQNRVSLELTGYQKTTDDALVSTGTGFDAGGFSYARNVGEVRNTGVEATLNATVAKTRAVTWDVTLNASVNHNTLVRLAPGILAQQFTGNFAIYRFAPGHPLYGYWAAVARYADLNHDGVIEPNEITIADSLTYTGSSLPTREMSVGTHVGLWGGAVSVGALADYRGGFRLLNSTAVEEAAFGPQSDRASNDRSAPLWQQARDIAYETLEVTSFGLVTPAGFYEDATYLRLRELSLTYVVPSTVARALKMRELSLTGAVRNLALWTRYTGTDPEVANSGGQNAQLDPSSNTFVVNNNIREDRTTVPLPRSWVVRLNIGLP